MKLSGKILQSIYNLYLVDTHPVDKEKIAFKTF